MLGLVQKSNEDESLALRILIESDTALMKHIERRDKRSRIVCRPHNSQPGPQREKFPGGTKVYTEPPNLIGPPKPYWAHAVNHCLSDGCRSSLERGDNDIRIQFGPMKNTTRHKTALNRARGTGGALWAPPAGSLAKSQKL